MSELPPCPACGERPVSRWTQHEWDYCLVCLGHGQAVPKETDAEKRARIARGEVLSPRMAAEAERYRRIYPWLRRTP